jgi:hypothetical protein
LAVIAAFFRRSDLLARFLLASFGLHSLTVLPWARILAWMLVGLGMRPSPVEWKKDTADAPTVIPIDLDQLDDGKPDLPNQPEPPRPVGTSDPTGGQLVTGDAGPPVPEAGPGDAGAEGGLEAGVGDAASDAPDAAPVKPKRIKDPNALAGGLEGIKPKSKEVNVSVLVRMDHLRAHPIGKQLGGKLAKIPEWKPFFDGTGIDPVRDLDALYANGPRFHETSRVTAIIVHNKPDIALTLVLQGMYKAYKGEWIGDEDVPAFRAKIDKADRAVVQIPGGLIVTPLDGEKQAFEIARAMVKKKKRASDMVPKGDADLVLGAYMRKPSNVLTAIPEDLHDTNITIRLRKDNGTILDLDAKAKDEASAKADATAVAKLIESAVPKGFIGVLARKYVAGYTVDADGDVVRFHHELDGDKLETAWSLLGGSL